MRGEGVFTKDKAGKTLRQLALEAIEQTSFYPRKRTGPFARHMIANRPRLVISRQRAWGRCRFHSSCTRETGDLHPRTMEISIRPPPSSKKGGIEAWSRVTAEDILGVEEAPHQTKSNRHSGSVVGFRQHLLACAAWHPPGQNTIHRGQRLTCTWGPRPAPRLFHSSLLLA